MRIVCARRLRWRAQDRSHSAPGRIYTPKCLRVLRHSRDPGHSSVQARLSHFTRINDGKSRLFLKSFRPPIPELRCVVESVQYRRSVALASSAVDADGNRSSVSESACRIVACTAGNTSVHGQAPVEKELFAQRDLLRVSTREMTEHGTRLANISLNPYPIWRAQGRSATIGFWLLRFGHIPILQVAQPCSGKRLRKAN